MLLTNRFILILHSVKTFVSMNRSNIENFVTKLALWLEVTSHYGYRFSDGSLLPEAYMIRF